MLYSSAYASIWSHCFFISSHCNIDTCTIAGDGTTVEVLNKATDRKSKETTYMQNFPPKE